MEKDVTASQHKHHRTTLERVEKYISHNQFKDVNLRSKLFPEAKQVDSMLTWMFMSNEQRMETLWNVIKKEKC